MIVGGSAFKEGGHGPADLKRLLESVRPAKVEQIVIVDTGAGEEGEAVIVQESQGRVVQGLPPIEVVWFDWCDDFAAARNESLAYVTTDWFFWADHDDWIENPEGLREIINEVAQDDVGGVWLPYRYAFDEYGNTTTLHDRERLLRLSVGWHWERRIHEVLSPHSFVQWAKDDRTAWNHMRGNESHAVRNLPLLLRMVEDNPDDARVWKDLGNQYFMTGEWPKAIDWYKKYIASQNGVQMERWQCMCYAARAYRELGDLQNAHRMDNLALMLIPSWNDAYLGLAQTYALMEDWEKTIYWAEESRTKDVPSRYLFLNPLEAQIMACKLLETAYGNLGQWDRAIEECDGFLALRPNEPEIKDHRDVWVRNKAYQRDIDAFAGASRLLSAEETVALADRLDGLKSTSQVRDVLMPAFMRRTELGTQPKMQLFCGNSFEAWHPGIPEEKGIGGSETAAIEIARRFAKDGWDVSVYNHCGKAEGEHDGVVYYDYRRWRGGKPDLFVAWRQTLAGKDQRLQANDSWLWLHNIYARLMEEAWPNYSRILGVSGFHADAMKHVYPFIEPERFGFVYNGVNLERFSPSVMPRREPHKVVWTSSPDRGLVYLLKMWPDIIKAVPDATLHIFYGWKNIDMEIAGGNEELKRVKTEVMSLAVQPGLVWRGRVSQKDLAHELLTAQMWAYPCIWQEEFCINAVEAMAAGVFPVTTDMGALPEVMGDVGYHVPIRDNYKPTQKRWRRGFAGIMLAGLLDDVEREKFREAGPARATQFTWDDAYKNHWVPKLKVAVEV